MPNFPLKINHFKNQQFIYKIVLITTNYESTLYQFNGAIRQLAMFMRVEVSKIGLIVLIKHSLKIFKNYIQALKH